MSNPQPKIEPLPQVFKSKMISSRLMVVTVRERF